MAWALAYAALTPRIRMGGRLQLHEQFVIKHDGGTSVKARVTRTHSRRATWFSGSSLRCVVRRGWACGSVEANSMSRPRVRVRSFAHPTQGASARRAGCRRSRAQRAPTAACRNEVVRRRLRALLTTKSASSCCREEAATALRALSRDPSVQPPRHPAEVLNARALPCRPSTPATTCGAFRDGHAISVGASIP